LLAHGRDHWLCRSVGQGRRSFAVAWRTARLYRDHPPQWRTPADADERHSQHVKDRTQHVKDRSRQDDGRAGRRAAEETDVAAVETGPELLRAQRGGDGQIVRLATSVTTVASASGDFRISTSLSGLSTPRSRRDATVSRCHRKPVTSLSTEGSAGPTGKPPSAAPFESIFLHRQLRQRATARTEPCQTRQQASQRDGSGFLWQKTVR